MARPLSGGGKGRDIKEKIMGGGKALMAWPLVENAASLNQNGEL